jgi:hypothetical protein
MPVSIIGIGTPATPSAPPSAMTSGKTTGRIQIAGAPRKAPQRPTATIATTWSQPRIGCQNPLAKPVLIPSPVWAATWLAAKG